jgi:uncharacterized protein
MVAVDHERLAELCEQHGVAVLKIFRSAARGDDAPDSDIDLLIEFTEMFGRKVDLVTEASLGPYIRDRILTSASVIYEGEG